jgi:hypothetical protein
MNVDLSTKPQVTINLDPVLEAYLRAVFKTPRHQKEIILNRGRREGQAIYSKILPVEFPKKRPFCENPVIFILPLTKSNHYTLGYRFYTVTKMGEEQIADDLRVLMDKWLFRFFQRGYLKKFTQDEIVNAVLRGLNLRKNAVNYDAIKKFDYRERRRIEEKTFDELLTCTDPVY